MALPTSEPPLLLTKRLSAFLHANQIPQQPTLLLTTYHGKLLAHASPNPVAILRTHATVAASLVAIHTSSSADVPFALPGSEAPDPISSSSVVGPGDDDNGHNPDPHDDSASNETAAHMRPDPSVRPDTVTVQLTGGTIIIRRLECGLLLVCIGPSAQDAQPDTQGQQQEEKDDNVEDVGNIDAADADNNGNADIAGSTGNTDTADTADTADNADQAEDNDTAENAGSAVMADKADDADNTQNVGNTGNADNTDHAENTGNADNAEPATDSPATPSQAQSLGSSESRHTKPSVEPVVALSIAEMRERAIDLARWLDDKLTTLHVPEEFVGTSIPGQI